MIRTGLHIRSFRAGWYHKSSGKSNIEDGEYPCRHYRTADKMLSESKEPSLELIREVLEETARGGNGLKKGTIYIYNRRNFDEAIILNLAEELERGERRITLPGLFKRAE